MTTPVWQIERELEYAKARETYFRTRTPTDRARVARSTQGVNYRSLLIKLGTAQPIIKLQASTKAVDFFGGADGLGLITTLPADDAPIPKPKGFKPSLVKAMEGNPTPTAARAFNNTGRRYIKYSKATDGEAQAHYQAPISAPTTPTVADVQTKFNAIKTAKASALGDYGRLYLSLEVFNQSGF